jgi:hypothetical protein
VVPAPSDTELEAKRVRWSGDTEARVSINLKTAANADIDNYFYGMV